MTHENFKECLWSQKPQMRKMNVLRSYQHEIFSETVNKIALSANDDKRLILDDKISTLAYGQLEILRARVCQKMGGEPERFCDDLSVDIFVLTYALIAIKITWSGIKISFGACFKI